MYENYMNTLLYLGLACLINKLNLRSELKLFIKQIRTNNNFLQVDQGSIHKNLSYLYFASLKRINIHHWWEASFFSLFFYILFNVLYWAIRQERQSHLLEVLYKGGFITFNCIKKTNTVNSVVYLFVLLIFRAIWHLRQTLLRLKWRALPCQMNSMAGQGGPVFITEVKFQRNSQR